MNDASAVPGWHGKLPSLGDFASRRLSPAFVEAWDGWLAAGLLRLREADPAGWLEAYLASPVWRFLLMPGVLPGEPGRQAWCGVLMPSVDRVGRYFPLTIARPLGEGPATALQMTALWHWLGRLDDLAADALEDDWPIDRLDAELGRMAAPELDPDSATAALPGAEPGTLAATALDGSLDAGGVIAAEAQALWRAAAAGRAYWYASSEIAGRRLIVSRGLPAPERLNALLGAKD